MKKVIEKSREINPHSRDPQEGDGFVEGDTRYIYIYIDGHVGVEKTRRSFVESVIILLLFRLE